MVMQDPKFSLNPVMTVGDQIAEAYLVHHKVPSAQARMRTLEMLSAVKIRDPERVYGLYPHEVSGGMGQRIMMAMMLIPDPDLLIADEPTSALDVTVSMQVLAILDDLVTQRGMDEADARARIGRQATREERLAKADFVVDNGGPPEALPAQVDVAVGILNEALEAVTRS